MAERKFKRPIDIFLVICLFGSCIYFYEYYKCLSQRRPSENSTVHVHSISQKAIQKVDKSGYYFQKCNCTKHRKILKRRLVKKRKRPTRGRGRVSQCSEESDWYGAGQRVVSYTLYNGTKIANDGHDDYFRMFADGILPNLKQIRKFYPGWILRLYSNSEMTKEFCGYACMDDVMWCDVRQSRFKRFPLERVNPRIWRFMPLGDPTVDIFVSRDLDSLINEREWEVVEDWLNSSFAIHCARDGLDSSKAMSAGIWGAKNSEMNAKEITSLREKMMKRGVNNKRAKLDEDLLRELIFYKYNYTILCHDSYSCKKYSVPSVPYPKQRRSTRVALEFRHMKKYKPVPCPVECRPSYGKNWTYC